MRRVIGLGCLLGLSGCGTPVELEPDFEPMLVASDDAVLWQGLHHAWRYNHRWGRLGSGFVRLHPDVVEDAHPLHGEIWEPRAPEGADGWYYFGSAGSGTGKDLGDHTVYGTHLRDAGVRFASTTAHVRMRHAEGETQLETLTVEASLPEGMEAPEVGEVVLNGFWLDAVNEEAKKPIRFRVDVGEASFDGGTFSADVTLELAADCDTPECDGCFTKSSQPISDTIEYDLYVDLLVITGTDDAFASTRFDGADVAEVWDGPPELEGPDACLGEGDRGDCLTYWVTCSGEVLADYEALPDDAGRDDLTVAGAASMPVGTVGVTGFELTLDSAHHMLQFEASATDIDWDPESGDLALRQNLRFVNWEHGMTERGQDGDVLSVTAFGVEGAWEGSMRFVALGFADATLASADAEHLIVTEATQLVVEPVPEPEVE